MSRTRVHNLMVSLDGYAAGEYVTAEEPIGGAAGLFRWFDGRVIHGIDRIADPVTLDRALISMWGQGVGVEITASGDRVRQRDRLPLRGRHPARGATPGAAGRDGR